MTERRFVVLFGVFVALVCFFTYIVMTALRASSYQQPSAVNCSAAEWRAITFSAPAFSQQYLNPTANLTMSFYDVCVNFTKHNDFSRRLPT